MAYKIQFDIFAKDRASDVVEGVGGKFDGLGSKLSKFGVAAGAAALAGGLAAAKIGWDWANVASDQGESLNKMSAIFGESAADIEKWAGDAAKNMGMSKTAALDVASGFGDMFLQLGFAGDQATTMSKSIAQLSADVGSFNNLPTAAVADKISAAFRGEYDSLQSIIPTINAAAVETKALGMTGKDSAKELTAQEKAAATYQLVLEGTTRAQGDFAKTSDGLANRQKTLGAMWDDLKARVGEKLLPALERLGNWFMDDGLPALEDFGGWLEDKLWPALEKGYETVMPGINKALEILGLNGADGGDAMKALGDFITDTLIPALAWLANEVLPIVATNMRMNIDGAKALWAGLQWLWDNVKRFASGLLMAFADVVDGFAWLLTQVGKVPGFKWAAEAGAAMYGAANAARQLAADILAIPNKEVSVVTKFRYDGLPPERVVTGSGYSSGGGRSTGGGSTAFADGGRPPLGQLSLVGERGPELFIPDGPGYVVDASMTRRILAGGANSGSPVFAPAAASASAAPVIITVNGALDPTAVARQIKKLLDDDSRLRGQKAVFA